MRQAEQHTAVAVNAAVINGERGGQHHDVERVRHEGIAQLVEDEHKRAGIRRDARPWQQGEKDRQGAHIEDQNTVDNLVSGFRDALLRVIGFCGGDAHQLQTAEGEHDDRHHHHQAGHAVRQEAALFPEVAHGCLRAAVSAEQQPAAENDHRHNGNHFDNGKPELHLTEHFYVGQVNGVDNNEEGRRRRPGGDLGIPELDVFPDGGQFSHGNQDVQHPVVPAGGEAREAAPVFIGEVAEGACDRLLNDHFTKLAHDQKRNETRNRVTQNNARTGRLDNRCTAQKQASTNSTAQGDELNMAVFKAAL